MIIVICGGRDHPAFRTFGEKSYLNRLVRKYEPYSPVRLVIHGGARGADSEGGKWAEARGIPVTVVNAEWGRYGKGAGMRRNRKMVDMLVESGEVSLVVGFPGGLGTAGMLGIASDYTNVVEYPAALPEYGELLAGTSESE